MPAEAGKIFLPYLMVALARAKFEGRLRLLEGNVERVVFWRAGKAVNVLSNLQEETLGRILLEEGRITTGQYQQLLDSMLKSGMRAGEALVKLGLVQPQEVFAALELQCHRKLCNCFKMRDFGFELHQEQVGAEKVLSVMDVSAMVLQGVKTCYRTDHLLEEFTVDEETVFKKRQPSPGLEIKLGTAEQKLLNRIGTATTLLKLKESSEDLATLLARLYAMHALELIEASGVQRPSLDDLNLGLETPAPPQEELEISIEVDEQAEQQSQNLSQAMQAAQRDAALAAKALSLDRDDFFTLLEVPQNAGRYEIQKAYQSQVERFNLSDIDAAYKSAGDRHLARRLLERLAQAVKVLCNDQQRRQYTESLKQAPAAADKRLLADMEAQKGEAALAAKRYGEAMECFDKAIGLYPDEAAYHMRLGLAAYFSALEETPPQDKIDERVRKPFLKALALRPNYDEARLYLGYISKRNGELERALKEFKSALQCNPKNERARAEIRQLERQLGGRG